MKHIIYYLIIACFVCGFTACSKLSKAAKYEAKVEECVAKRDFLSARNYYHKYAGLNLTGMGKERDQLLRKLNIAEINYVMDQSGIENAYFLADELGAKIEYLEVLAKCSSKMINSNQSNQLLSMLVTWNFECHLDADAFAYVYRDGMGSDLERYMLENNTYNAILDAILNFACLNDDAVLAKKVIRLYRPVLKGVYDKKREGVIYSYDNTPKSLATKKVKEAGIKL